jgi:hypothetical protein
MDGSKSSDIDMSFLPALHTKPGKGRFEAFVSCADTQNRIKHTDRTSSWREIRKEATQPELLGCTGQPCHRYIKKARIRCPDAPMQVRQGQDHRSCWGLEKSVGRCPREDLKQGLETCQSLGRKCRIERQEGKLWRVKMSLRRVPRQTLPR